MCSLEKTWKVRESFVVFVEGKKEDSGCCLFSEDGSLPVICDEMVMDEDDEGDEGPGTFFEPTGKPHCRRTV